MVDESREVAAGWIGFYWGKTPAEYRESKTIADATTGGWLEWFLARAREIQAEGRSQKDE